MAFADDPVLLEDDEAQLPITLGLVNDFFKARGLELNPSMSHALSVAFSQGRPVTRTKPFLRLGNRTINMVSTDQAFKYLSHSVESQGIRKPNLSNLSMWLSNLQRAPLKPDQKLALLKTYLLPRLFYGLQIVNIDRKILKEADPMIRRFGKKSLHLHLHTPNPVFHARVRDGRLGIQELLSTIPKVLSNQIVNLLDKSDVTLDPVLTYILQTDKARAILTKLNVISGENPSDKVWLQSIQDGPFTAGLEHCTHDSASRKWVYSKPNSWTGRDYIRAIHLRSANLPSKGILSNPADLRSCRSGCPHNETTCHILQGCPTTHGMRVLRHNEIVKKIAQHCYKKV